MASPLDSEDDNIFEKLQQSVDPKVAEEKLRAAEKNRLRQYAQTQMRQVSLVEDNSTLPCTINSIRILNARNTRRGFLEKIFHPILSANQDRPYTLVEAIREVSLGAEKLYKFDIFREPISLFLDRPDQTNPNTSPTDIDFYISVFEKSRVLLKTGTDVGNAEGSAYASLLYRNVFGGAENLNFNASFGTRTRSSYQAIFDTPILSNPAYRLEFGGLSSTTQKNWASHEEVLAGGWTKFKWLTTGGHRHEIGYTGLWRQITGLAANASPTVRKDAGDSVKSSITHTWINDRRDSSFLPSRGYYTKATSELAGFGPLRGDVSFWKSEIETQATLPIPIPGIKGNSGITWTNSLRGGLLYPLTLPSESHPQPSRINDRFQLGGPADVRGFRLSGLGPRDGPDAIGGDIYAAFSSNILFPLPRLGKDRPIRIQAFINGGRLLALKNRDREKQMDSAAVQRNFYSTIEELGHGLPSMSAGIGLVYAHPVARFELNFGVPLVLRRGEEGRKGLQFGIGINLL